MKLFRIFILAFFAISLIACGGAEERKAVYMEKAKSSIAAGDLDKARIDLKNVLQIDPKDSEAYYLIGKVFEQKQDYRNAFANYKKAEELDPNNLDNQARLGRIYLYLINDVNTANEKIDFILSKDPKNIEGLLLSAALMVKKGNESEAINIYKDVLDREPGNVDGVIFLATLYSKNGSLDKAKNILNNGLKVNKNNVRISKLLGLIYIESKDYLSAEEVYKKLLENAPDDKVNYKLLAAFYNSIDDKVKAENVLRASIDNDPNDIERYYDLVRYISVAKDNDAAINELKKLISGNNGLGGLRIALAEYYYINKQYEPAIEVYENAIKDFSEESTGIAARVGLAVVYLNKKEFDKADKIIEEAVTISPNDPKVNLLRAKIALFNKNIERAVIALRIVINETPDNIDAYILLSNTYRLEGNDEQSREILINARNNNVSNPDSLLKLAQYYLNKDTDLALAIIDDYNVLRKSDYLGLSIKAAILNKKHEVKKAFDVAKMLIDTFPDKPNGYLQSIPYYSQTGDKKKAISVLIVGYEKVKDNRKILKLLTALEVSDKKFDSVISRIQKEYKQSKNDVDLKILLAKVYLSKGDKDQAESLLKEIVKDWPTVEEPYILLTQIYQNDNRPDLVESTLIQGRNKIESSSKLSFKLAMLYELTGEYQKAIQVYKDIYELKPGNLIAVNNLASLLSENGLKENDLPLVKQLLEKLKGNDQAVFLDTIGWVYYKLGDYEAAIQYLVQVVEKSPKTNIFSYHLGMAYKMSGDKAQAKMYLEKSLADGKAFKEKDMAKAALKNL